MRSVVAVVDDNELTRVLAGDALSELGYAPVLYASCEAALAAFARDVPAACLVDQVLPGMSGADLVRAIRASQDPRLRALPVIAFTAGAEQKMLDAGARAVLRKPLKLPALQAALRDVLGAVDSPPAAAAPPPPHATPSPEPPARAGWGRRGSLRVTAALAVTLERGSWSVHGTTADLSTGGFSTVVNVGLAPGDVLRFVLATPPHPIRGSARVAGATAAGPGKDRLGLAFVELAPADREALEAVVREHARGGG